MPGWHLIERVATVLVGLAPTRAFYLVEYSKIVEELADTRMSGPSTSSRMLSERRKVDERSCQVRRVGPELRFAHSNCTLEQGLGLCYRCGVALSSANGQIQWTMGLGILVAMVLLLRLQRERWS